MSIPIGLCQCGCGKTTPIANRTTTSRGVVKGQPRRFCKGHGGVRRKEQNNKWNGGIHKDPRYGYIMEHCPGHPRGTYVFQHILVAERALGRYLTGTEEVHHVNGIRDDNRPQNLVICPDRAYHFLLHVRKRALETCGHAGWRKCLFCKQWDDAVDMAYNRHSGSPYHAECLKRYNRGRARQKRLNSISAHQTSVTNS